MKSKLIAASLTIALAGAASLAHAQQWNERDRYRYYEPRAEHYDDGRIHAIERRLERQRGRIIAGIQSGAISRQEAWALRNEQRTIRDKQRAYLADGRLNRWELNELQRDLDRAGEQIRRATRDYDWRS